jgi:predicted AlkP superfamily phosphohydrolase/phosphomutase
MKRFIYILIAVMVVLTGSVFAQGRGERPGPPPLPDSTEIAQMIDDLTTRLALDEEEANVIGQLFYEHFNDLKERMAEGRVPREEMETLRENFVKKVKVLLDEDQQKEFDKFMKAHTPQRPLRRERRR